MNRRPIFHSTLESIIPEVVHGYFSDRLCLTSYTIIPINSKIATSFSSPSTYAGMQAGVIGDHSQLKRSVQQSQMDIDYRLEIDRHAAEGGKDDRRVTEDHKNDKANEDDVQNRVITRTCGLCPEHKA